jgi:hypothetical protein
LQQSALVVTGILVLFFSYGHIYNLLREIHIAGVYLFRHRTLIPLWGALAILMLWWGSRRRKQISGWTYFLNIMGLVLLIVPVFQLTSFLVEQKFSDSDAQKSPITLLLDPGKEPPDIYYIILDGYGRSDVLKGYGYDNSDFLNSLRDLGFFVADCAQSNYAQTKISLASSLNINYLDALGEQYAPGSGVLTGLDKRIQHSVVRDVLEQAGYKTIGFATGFPMTQLTDADYYFAPQTSWTRPNEFESLLLQTTPAGAIQNQTTLDLLNASPQLSRERILFALDKLDEVPSIKGPKFVFVHLVLPHPPYVFGPTGGPAAPLGAGDTRAKQEAHLYRDQAIYASSRIMEIVPEIIANSPTPPIIVIQGDHGPTVPSPARERMLILNAYFLPGVQAPVYPRVTPVNTFRIIFNTYFGQNLALLDDVSLYSKARHPFDYRVIPNSCNATN